jgi:hypothetical protein
MGKFILDYYNWHGIFYIQGTYQYFTGGFGNDNWNFVHWKQEKFSKKVL